MKKITALFLLTFISTHAYANKTSLSISCFNAADIAAHDALPVKHSCSHVLSIIEKKEDSFYIANYNCYHAADIKTQFDVATGICKVIDIKVKRIKF